MFFRKDEHSMKLRKIFLILLSIMIIGTLFGGCQKEKNKGQASGAQEGAAKQTEPVKIDYWGGWTGTQDDAMKGLVEKYNKEQDKVKVQFNSMDWNALTNKFISATKDGSVPDILAMRSYEIGKAAEMGALDFSIAEEVKVNKSDYADAIWNSGFYKQKQFGIPIVVNINSIFYNKEILDKAGLREMPKTGDDLISMAQQLTVDRNGKHPNESGFDEKEVLQYGLGINTNYNVFYHFYTLYNQQAGAKQLTETMTKLDIEEDKAAKAFGFIEDLIFKYKVVPKDEKSPVDDFKGGKVAMFIDGSWQMPTLEASNIKWQSAVYPKVFDKQVIGGVTEVLTFPLKKGSEDSKREAIQDFVSWLDKNSGDLAKAGQIPVSKSGLEATKALQGRNGFIDSVDKAIVVPPNQRIPDVFNNPQLNTVITSVQDSIASGKDPREISRQLESGIDAILAK